MAKNLDQTGVMLVNGAWATRVHYDAAVLGPNAGTVDLRFMQGRAEVARASLSHEQLADLLGERNSSTIEKHVASDADRYLPSVKGELRGTRLHYREVMLAATESRAQENSLGVSRARAQTVDQSLRGQIASQREPSLTPTPNKWLERAAFERIQKRFDDSETLSLNALDRASIRAVVTADLAALAQIQNTELRRDALSTVGSLAVEFSNYKTELVRQAPDIDKDAERVNREIDHPLLGDLRQGDFDRQPAYVESASSRSAKLSASDIALPEQGNAGRTAPKDTEQERAAHRVIEKSYYDSVIAPDVYGDVDVARAIVNETLTALQTIHGPALRRDALATIGFLSENFPSYKSELRRLAPETEKEAAQIDEELQRRVSGDPNPTPRSQDTRTRPADTAGKQEPGARDTTAPEGGKEGAQDKEESADPTKATDDAKHRATNATSRPSPKAAGDSVPQHIASKYLVKDDTYSFDDQTIAFVDRGDRLTVLTHNKAVMRDVVEIASVRDWTEVTVTGTQSFRREAWKEAHAAGLTVKGYKPSEIELEAANRERLRRNGPNELSADERERKEPAAAPRSESSRPQRQPDSAKDVLFGTLVSHGEAPYHHDATKSVSYYVTLKQTDGQERTRWGKGLADAIQDAKSGPAIGDLVGVQRVGSTPMIVTSRTLDAHGEPVVQQIDTQRNHWVVEKARYFHNNQDLQPESRIHPSSHSPEKTTVVTTTDVDSKSNSPKGMTRDQEVAAAIRSAETTREELQLKYPELNKAVFQHLESHAQFAAAYVKAGLIRESDRAQVIAQMRERLASQIERGAPIKEPDNQRVNTLIRRSVDRVAADIGRQPIEIQPRAAEQATTLKSLVRDDVQVRA